MTSKTDVASHLEMAIKLSGKTQREIANEAGYSNSNIISMMKNGITKIPVEKIPALAAATGVEPAPFIRLALQEYMPETWKVIHANLEALKEDI
ncbi:helix-turn-helix transcriptional regulator [Ruegeria pomeroyi]|nr:helix-turn-helix transcriptional regulator [Ruegeria pomeroyi]MCE8544481.1 helix-turn-helix transcriptional regulator [Ruegeria pomeroyi]